MTTYQLRFQFKSNERPWAGSLDGRRIENDEQAKDWARRFEASIGDDYYVSLWKHGMPMSFSIEFPLSEIGMTLVDDTPRDPPPLPSGKTHYFD